MKISEKWLREWVNPNISRDELCKQLTMAGLEIEGIELLGEGLNNIVVAEVLSAEQHPDADKLRVAQVKVGNETLQIVCGASNCRPGIKIPAALVGASLPGGLNIKRAKLRGVESNGMLCSAKELGMAEESEGILELPADAPVGMPIVDFFKLNDAVLEINLTPNRGDCLGVIGVARELAVLNKMPFTLPAIVESPATINDKPSIELLAPEACPRYCGRIVKGINPNAETPLWMVEKLRRGGIESISLPVDITNFVLLELGHPMHAFDLREIKGGIRVRTASEGEKLTLLDGREVTLTADTLLIADHEKPVAIGGVMGGEHSGIADDTTDVLLEAAFFTPHLIAGKARQYGLHTDASHRYERGVDPTLQCRAIERATELLLQLAGGQAGPVIDAVSEAHLPNAASIHLRRARIPRLLGFSLPDPEVEGMLTRLGLTLTPTAEGWQCQVPAHRFDISIEADLIEELIRIHGYHHLSVTTPHGDMAMARVPEHVVGDNAMRDLLVDRGYQEVVTFTFVEPNLMRELEPGLEPLPLINPITPEMAVMRTSLWAGLLSTAKHNLNRQVDRLAMFEIGLRFVQEKGELNQQKMIAGLLHGPRNPMQWNHGRESFDFFDLKGDIEALLSLGGTRQVEFLAAVHHALHPGQSAAVFVNGKLAGHLGALHPERVKALDLEGDFFVFELIVDVISDGVLPRYKELSKFPSVARDLAVVVEESISASHLQTVIRESAGEALEDLKVFDIYRGKGIDSGRKSVALGLTLRHPSRTLTDSDVHALMAAVVGSLQTHCGAQLRE